jgi:ADP-ribose pyrophosphatase
MNSSTAIKAKETSRETVFQSKHFRVDRVTIERNGRTFVKDFIERVSSVHIIPYTKDDELYLEWQYRDLLKKVSLEVIGGKMREGDEPLEAAKRELHEETGLTANNWKKIGVLNLSGNIKQAIYVFAATDIEEGEKNLDEDELIETVKIPLNEVVYRMQNGEMSDSSHIASIFLFKHLREEGKI